MTLLHIVSCVENTEAERGITVDLLLNMPLIQQGGRTRVKPASLPLRIAQIRPYLAQHATQLLVQAMVISRLDYCNALLTCLPAGDVKPLQMVQNATACLVFDHLKRAHVTPLFIELHWLPLAARIKFKSLMLAYKVLNGTAPTYLNALAKAYVTTRSLLSSQDCLLAVPTLCLHSISTLSSLSPLTEPDW